MRSKCETNNKVSWINVEKYPPESLYVTNMMDFVGNGPNNDWGFLAIEFA